MSTKIQKKIVKIDDVSQNMNKTNIVGFIKRNI